MSKKIYMLNIKQDEKKRVQAKVLKVRKCLSLRKRGDFLGKFHDKNIP